MSMLEERDLRNAYQEQVREIESPHIQEEDVISLGCDGGEPRMSDPSTLLTLKQSGLFLNVCSVCHGLEKGARVTQNLLEIKSSADRGCDECVLLRDTMTHHEPEIEEEECLQLLVSIERVDGGLRLSSSSGPRLFSINIYTQVNFIFKGP